MCPSTRQLHVGNGARCIANISNKNKTLKSKPRGPSLLLCVFIFSAPRAGRLHVSSGHLRKEGRGETRLPCLMTADAGFYSESIRATASHLNSLFRSKASEVHCTNAQHSKILNRVETALPCERPGCQDGAPKTPVCRGFAGGRIIFPSFGFFM